MSRAARIPASCMDLVRVRKLSVFWSSMTRVLEVLAPLIPSLNAPVIFELIFRTFRFQ